MKILQSSQSSSSHRLLSPPIVRTFAPNTMSVAIRKAFIASTAGLKSSAFSSLAWIQSNAALQPILWDKDKDGAMEFFTAALINLRANMFCISQKNCFNVKEMAGNIIPDCNSKLS
ncbi:hypothetical protein PTTG_29757, partial [Puccinia triticina 1-1 BBBD Race 1]